MHFFVVSQAPLLSDDSTSNYTKITTQQLTASVLDPNSCYVNLDAENGKFLTASVIYRFGIRIRFLSFFPFCVLIMKNVVELMWPRRGAPDDVSTFEVDREIAAVKYDGNFIVVLCVSLRMMVCVWWLLAHCVQRNIMAILRRGSRTILNIH